MSQTEELLNSLSTTDISTYSADSSVEPHIVIGSDRIITVPDSLKRIAVQYDHNVETVTFDCPRYWDGLDMSTMKVYINYMLPNRMKGAYVADNVAVDETDTNIMHFTWTISRNVTATNGSISFLVCIKKVDSEGNEENHWNSELNTELYISKGLETTEVIGEAYHDLITQLLTRMDHLIESDSTILDTSLTESGVAADAGAVGQTTKSLSNRISHITTCVTPKMYGAVGDGVADDTDAIQSAINYVTANGGILRFPGNTTYVISKPIQIITNQKSFEIDFGYSTITCGSEFNSDTINSEEINSAFYIYTKTSNQKKIGTIKNLIIDGKYENIHTGLWLGLSSKLYYENINFIDVRRGIYFKKGVESFFDNIHMSRSSGIDITSDIDLETTDCIGIDCYATDNHFSNIIVIDFVIGMNFRLGSGDNRVYGAHVWNYYCKTQYKKSVCFMNSGSNFYTNCVADHFFVGWYIYGAGVMYLNGCNITCKSVKDASKSVIGLNSYAFYFGDSNSKNRTGSDIIANDTRITGDPNDYSESVTLTFSNISDCNINYSGIAQNCEKVPVPNMPVMVSGKTVIDDANNSKINQYGGIKSVEKVLEFEECSTDFSDITDKTYASGMWLSNYLQVSSKTSVAVSGNSAAILPKSDATGYNYLRLYLNDSDGDRPRKLGLKNGDLIMISYKYKTDSRVKSAYASTAKLTPYTSLDAVNLLTPVKEWCDGYRFFTISDVDSAVFSFGDSSTGENVDKNNPLYLTNIRVINLSKYNIPKYYLETDKAYRARLIKLFGTTYATSVTIPARTDISFASIPYKFSCTDVSSESDQMIGFSSLGKPIILTRTSDYKFNYIYTNDTPSSITFELSKYTITQSGATETNKIEVYIDNTKIPMLTDSSPGLYNWSYTKNIVVPSGSTLKLVFTILAGEECMFSKLVINPYNLSNIPIVDATDGYSKIPLYADGEICLIAKNKSGEDLPTAYFEVEYSKPYYTVEEFESLESRIAALEAAGATTS